MCSSGAKLRSRVMGLAELTETEGFDRLFRDGPGVLGSASM